MKPIVLGNADVVIRELDRDLEDLSSNPPSALKLPGWLWAYHSASPTSQRCCKDRRIKALSVALGNLYCKLTVQYSIILSMSDSFCLSFMAYQQDSGVSKNQWHFEWLKLPITP